MKFCKARYIFAGSIDRGVRPRGTSGLYVLSRARSAESAPTSRVDRTSLEAAEKRGPVNLLTWARRKNAESHSDDILSRGPAPAGRGSVTVSGISFAIFFGSPEKSTGFAGGSSPARQSEFR